MNLASIAALPYCQTQFRIRSLFLMYINKQPSKPKKQPLRAGSTLGAAFLWYSSQDQAFRLLNELHLIENSWYEVDSFWVRRHTVSTSDRQQHDALLQSIFESQSYGYTAKETELTERNRIGSAMYLTILLPAWDQAQLHKQSASPLRPRWSSC